MSANQKHGNTNSYQQMMCVICAGVSFLGCRCLFWSNTLIFHSSVKYVPIHSCQIVSGRYITLVFACEIYSCLSKWLFAFFDPNCALFYSVFFHQHVLSAIKFKLRSLCSHLLYNSIVLYPFFSSPFLLLLPALSKQLLQLPSRPLNFIFFYAEFKVVYCDKNLINIVTQRPEYSLFCLPASLLPL